MATHIKTSFQLLGTNMVKSILGVLILNNKRKAREENDKKMVEYKIIVKKGNIY